MGWNFCSSSRSWASCSSLCSWCSRHLYARFSRFLLLSASNRRWSKKSHYLSNIFCASSLALDKKPSCSISPSKLSPCFMIRRFCCLERLLPSFTAPISLLLPCSRSSSSDNADYNTVCSLGHNKAPEFSFLCSHLGTALCRLFFCVAFSSRAPCTWLSGWSTSVTSLPTTDMTALGLSLILNDPIRCSKRSWTLFFVILRMEAAVSIQSATVLK